MSLFQNRVVDPLERLLRQGLSPPSLALSLVLGALLGVFPILGSTTLLCTVAALGLRLNLVAMQIANYLVYPLQFALLLPFIRAGEFLFGAEPLPLSPGELRDLVGDQGIQAFEQLWRSTLHAVTAWAITAPPVGIPLFLVLRRALLRAAVGMGDSNGSDGEATSARTIGRERR